MPDVDNVFVGRVGDVYVLPHGSAHPFAIPVDSTVDVTASLPAAWLNGNLGYLHEDDTPSFEQDRNIERVSAWQLAGNTLRSLLNMKVRKASFTVRELNREVWNLIEPETAYTTGVGDSVSATVPVTSNNPPVAILFEIRDIDASVAMRIYVPRVTVTDVGALQFKGTDTANVQLTVEFENDLDTGLYFVVSNHPGWAA